MDVETLTGDRDAFNRYVYTPWPEAVEILEERRKETALAAYVEKLLPQGLPPIMQGKKSMVLFRHIATPNYEISRFLIAADALSDRLQPLILEYTKDRFNNRNEWKFSLAKLRFQKGTNKLGEPLFEFKNIIDINAANNQEIASVKTTWGQPLVEFHHELFAEAYPSFSENVFDLSEWLHDTATVAKDYYKYFLALFLRDGILFENFMLEGKELAFTKEVILPTIMALETECGFKPLIVPLEPTHVEGDEFWLSHPYHRMQRVVEKLQKQDTGLL